MSKVSEQWVPHLLFAKEKEVRVRLSPAFLRRWRKNGMQFLNRIITTDETWVNFYDPETKTGIDGVEDKFVTSSKTSESCKVREKNHVHLHGQSIDATPTPSANGQTVNKKYMYYQKVNLFYCCWLVGFGFKGPLRQYFSLYRAVSRREGERGEKR